MSSNFHRQIEIALGNENLQVALDGNAERRINAFEKAYSNLPEPLQEMRKKAHAVRAKVIDRHEEYLEQFVEKARGNGFLVHHAPNADDAVGIVLDIAGNSSAKLIAKSKSMVSEEIHLNQALLDAGYRVVETDLGEYIIQLLGQPPSHIITPAVHLRRQQVGEIFHEKLDIPYSEDISRLTLAARKKLRQTFLDADIGISGVNFGIADSGSLCMVTNEGNGRMVTTLPPVHVALMGIERLVPSYHDLALMLYLLPRSATGQKMTVYTSLINGPRADGELDGARTRHLVLVDNGRTRVRDSALRESLYCIRCGACLNVCPVFREIGGHTYVGDKGEIATYPGPIGSVISPGFFGIGEYAHLARASSLCGACKEACPVDIDLPKMLLRVRAGKTAGSRKTNQPEYGKESPQKVPWSLKLGLHVFTWTARSPRRFGAAQRLAGLLARVISPRSDWVRLPGVTGWGYSRDFPRPAARPFHDRFVGSTVSLKTDKEATQRAELSSGKDYRFQDEFRTASKPLPTPEDLVEMFSEELTAVNGSFIRCALNAVGEHVLAILNEKGITRMQVWEESEILEELPQGLFKQLEAHGIQLQTQPDPEFMAGLTGASAGVAESGTLVLASGPSRPGTASLLPEVHIAILKKENIYQNLNEVFELPEIASASSVSLITGPSRTADIEMTLTIGVHGPGEVHVICV